MDHECGIEWRPYSVGVHRAESGLRLREIPKLQHLEIQVGQCSAGCERSENDRVGKIQLY